MEYRRGRITQDYRRWGSPAKLARCYQHRADREPASPRAPAHAREFKLSRPNVFKLSGADGVRCNRGLARTGSATDPRVSSVLNSRRTISLRAWWLEGHTRQNASVGI